MKTETCSHCGKKTNKYSMLPVVESPKDNPHNEPFCMKCAVECFEDYEPEYEPEVKEERLYQESQQ